MGKPLILLASGLCVLVGVSMFLYPQVVSKLNQALNRNLVILDHAMLRFRYVIGALLLVTAYCFFILSLTV